MSWDIADKNVLVTGGSSGIGRAAAEALSQSGARVTITSRDPDRVAAAASSIADTTGSKVQTALVDLTVMASVRSFGAQFASENGQIDVLVNNAGGVFGSRRLTADGHEMTFATNHLGPFLLTTLLGRSLGSTGPSRVINVSSVAHTYAKEGILFDDLGWENHKYKTMGVYGHSKLANILHAHGINERTGPAVQAYAMHPGVVGTSFGGRGGSTLVRAATKFGKRWMRTPAEGADTIVWLATEPEVDIAGGIYFTDRMPHKTTRFADDADQIARLWEASEQMTGDK